jgi:integrase
MSVRKRQWTTSKGEAKEAWIVDYADGKGTRRLKTFERKKEADAWAAQTHTEVRAGVHVADSASITVQDAGDLWVARAKSDGLERATLQVYGQHLAFHIYPLIGNVKLSQLTTPKVRAFEDSLREGRSTTMVRRVLRTLGAIIADAQERGLVAHNVVKELKSRRRKKGEGRDKGKKKIGIDIPTPDEIKLILAHAKPRWRPLLVTAVFTGLRASELRGLRWSDINLDASEVHVHQRADRFNTIGRPKSASSERTVPFGKFVANTLREWKLACPKSELDLVFPTATGKIERLTNIVDRGLKPTEIAAGIVTADGKAKYPGMHVFRHFYASWCIDRNLPPKVIQTRLGHASITMTFDVYGHLFPEGDDTGLDAAELKLLA